MGLAFEFEPTGGRGPSTEVGISKAYLQHVCGGVPEWEVEVFLNPLVDVSGAESLGDLMQLAQAARAGGEKHRAYLLAERAYAAGRQIPTLLFLADLRVHEFSEPAFGCAVYHSALRMLPLSSTERSTVEALLAETELRMLSGRRQEDSVVLIQHRVRQWSKAQASMRRSRGATHFFARGGLNTPKHTSLGFERPPKQLLTGPAFLSPLLTAASLPERTVSEDLAWMRPLRPDRLSDADHTESKLSAPQTEVTLRADAGARQGPAPHREPTGFHTGSTRLVRDALRASRQAFHDTSTRLPRSLAELLPSGDGELPYEPQAC